MRLQTFLSIHTWFSSASIKQMSSIKSTPSPPLTLQKLFNWVPQSSKQNFKRNKNVAVWKGKVSEKICCVTWGWNFNCKKQLSSFTCESVESPSAFYKKKNSSPSIHLEINYARECRKGMPWRQRKTPISFGFTKLMKKEHIEAKRENYVNWEILDISSSEFLLLSFCVPSDFCLWTWDFNFFLGSVELLLWVVPLNKSSY